MRNHTSIKYAGVWTPLITPFRAGEIDYVAAADLARYLVAAGIHGLVVSGTTGEGPALSTPEKARLIDHVAQAAGDHVPVFLGLEGAIPAKIVAELGSLGDAPFDGCLLPPPSYVRPSQEGIYAHFAVIAEAAKRPVMIYDTAARTGAKMSIKLIASLSATGLFPAIKACGLSDDRLRQLCAIPDLSVLCGDDAWLLKALQAGADGAVMATSQVAPHLSVELLHLFGEGKTTEAERDFHRISPLIEAMFAEPNPAPVKAALAFQSWTNGELRPPMTPISETLWREIGALLQTVSWEPVGHLSPDKSNK